MPQRWILVDADTETHAEVRDVLAAAFPESAVEFTSDAWKRFGWDEDDCRALIEQSPEPIFIYGPEGVLYANGAAAATVGFTQREVLGHPILEFVHPDDRGRVLARMRDVLVKRVAVEPVELRLLHRGGSSRYVEVVSVPVSYRGQPAAQVIGRDVTERRDAEARLRHAAFHDALTGLPNRAALLEHLAERLEGPGAPVAVAFLDLDEFKVVNDTLGHGVGDDVLRWVARRLTESAGSGAFVARFGGDEFVMVMDADPAPDAVLAAIRGVVQGSLGWTDAGGTRVQIRGSTGVAIGEAGDPEADANELLRRADLALYHVKADGRGETALFDPAHHSRMHDRLRLEGALTDALHAGAITAHYQPILRLSDGAIVGAEALARWSAPGLGSVPPDRFVPVAQQVGLGFALDMAVLRHACGVAAGHSHLSVSVNVSASHLGDARLTARVAEVLQETGLPPHRLALEITERDALRSPELAIRTLHALRSLGVVLHLDDFGTGHSALAYLDRLPIHAVKLDRYFVSRGLEREGILQALVALARAFGLQVIAEGVEDEATLGAVRAAGCDYAQGYHISRPISAEALFPFLAGKNVV